MLFTVAPVPLSAGKRDAISTASVLFTTTTAHFSSAAGDAISRKSESSSQLIKKTNKQTETNRITHLSISSQMVSSLALGHQQISLLLRLP